MPIYVAHTTQDLGFETTGFDPESPLHIEELITGARQLIAAGIMRLYELTTSGGNYCFRPGLSDPRHDKAQGYPVALSQDKEHAVINVPYPPGSPNYGVAPLRLAHVSATERLHFPMGSDHPTLHEVRIIWGVVLHSSDAQLAMVQPLAEGQPPTQV